MGAISAAEGTSRMACPEFSPAFPEKVYKYSKSNMVRSERGNKVWYGWKKIASKGQDGSGRCKSLED